MQRNDGTASQATQRWRVGCILTMLALLLVLLASCALGSVGIRHGRIQPPTIQQHLGPIYLIARTTRSPTCGALQCPEYLFLNPDAAQRRYVVSVVVIWPRPTGRRISVYHLTQISLDHS
jgi:hypothetical protein